MLSYAWNGREKTVYRLLDCLVFSELPRLLCGVLGCGRRIIWCWVCGGVLGCGRRIIWCWVCGGVLGCGRRIIWCWVCGGVLGCGRRVLGCGRRIIWCWVIWCGRRIIWCWVCGGIIKGRRVCGRRRIVAFCRRRIYNVPRRRSPAGQARRPPLRGAFWSACLFCSSRAARFMVFVIKPAILFFSSLEVIIDISIRVFLLSSKFSPKTAPRICRVSPWISSVPCSLGRGGAGG